MKAWEIYLISTTESEPLLLGKVGLVDGKIVAVPASEEQKADLLNIISGPLPVRNRFGRPTVISPETPYRFFLYLPLAFAVSSRVGVKVGEMSVDEAKNGIVL